MELQQTILPQMPEPTVTIEEAVAYEFFITPARLAYAMMRMVCERYVGYGGTLRLDVLDFGAGDGALGRALSQVHSHIVLIGAEIRDTPKPPWYSRWDVLDAINGDIKYDNEFDLVISNPPFSHDNLWRSIVRGYRALRWGGYAVFLARVAAIAGQDRCGVLYQNIPYRAVYVLPERPGFTDNGKTDKAQEYIVLVFQKGYKPTPEQPREIRDLWWKCGYSIDVPPAEFKARKKELEVIR